MNHNEINNLAFTNQVKERKALKESVIAEIREYAGCRVNPVGSLRMFFSRV